MQRLHGRRAKKYLGQPDTRPMSGPPAFTPAKQKIVSIFGTIKVALARECSPWLES